ncbi:hypothetical protein AAFC00_001041 [Neodothiora populina]|uniref:cyclin-dependent kinase n=1 Tax=Neodothiora populina TaxID=2781224 RepID=A0ABR3PMN6_9PEZI
MADWRPSVTFSDRFTWVFELQAVRSSQPQKADDELKAWPQSTENQAYSSCTSKEEYEAKLKAEIEKQKTLAAVVIESKDDEDDASWEDFEPSHASTEKVSFGAYKDAIPFRDGSSSTVYKASSPTDPRQRLALKVTTPNSQPAPHDSLREIRMLQLLGDHPNIIPLLDSPNIHNHLILVFPFVPCPLDQILLRQHTSPQLIFSPARKKAIIHDLMTGLAYMHAQGIIHRDIKPSNILLSTPHSGPAQIIDFGTAYAPPGSLGSDTAATEHPDAKVLDVGTTSYRAPELLFGNQRYDAKLDMWAAGCVVAEILAPAEKWRRRPGKNNNGSTSNSHSDGIGSRDGTTLFDSGDLGSELALIKSVFETLGTPDGQSWPESASLPDWGKMTFVSYPAKAWSEILPSASDVEVSFVQRLLRYETAWRMSAAQALEHEYLA